MQLSVPLKAARTVSKWLAGAVRAGPQCERFVRHLYLNQGQPLVSEQWMADLIGCWLSVFLLFSRFYFVLFRFTLSFSVCVRASAFLWVEGRAADWENKRTWNGKTLFQMQIQKQNKQSRDVFLFACFFSSACLGEKHAYRAGWCTQTRRVFETKSSLVNV